MLVVGLKQPRPALAFGRDGQPGHRTAQAAEHAALEINQARVLGRQPHEDVERRHELAQGGRLGGRERIAAVLGHVDVGRGLRGGEHGRGDARDNRGRETELARQRAATVQPVAGNHGQARRRGQRGERGRGRQQAALEAAQHARQRHAGKRLQQAALSGRGEIQHPEPERDGERQDGGGGTVVGERGAHERDAGDGARVDEVAGQQHGDFGRRDVPAEQPPGDQRGHRDERHRAPGDQQRGELGGEDRRQRIGHLQRQFQAAGLLLGAERADGDERKQERRGQIERAEGRHQDAVERRQPARQQRRFGGGTARLGIERHRLIEAGADQRRQQHQQHPERTAGRQIAHFLADQGGARRGRADRRFR